MSQASAISARDPRLDLLRIAGSVAVVCVHAAGATVFARADQRDLTWWVANLTDSVSRWCVPVFVMVTGALLLRPSRDESLARFYRTRLSKLLPPVLFWSAFYIALRSYIDGRFDAQDAWNRFVQGTPHFHLWYLYMLLGLYFVTPWLKRAVAQASDKELKAMAWAGLGLASIASMANRFHGVQPTTFLALFVPYIPYLLMGHWFARRATAPAPGNTGSWMLAATCAVVIAASAWALVPVLGTRGIDVAYEFLNPMAILFAVAVFGLGMSATVESPRALAAIAFLAPLTFGVYLIHPFWLTFLYKFGVHGGAFHPLVGMPATVVGALALSAASVFAMSKIPYLRAVVPG